MSNKESKGAIWASFAANIGIGICKFVAFLLTGATSMLAESAHSIVDSSNQVLLLIGGRQSRQEPNHIHPFGYGRAHFLYAFIVSIVLFSLGGMFAVYEGAQKIIHPEEIVSPVIAYVVIAIAMTLEGLALRTVLREARVFKPADQHWWEFLHQTKSINHIILALEDSAALLGLTFATIGLTLSLVTGNPIWDGIGTVSIGILLVSVAYFLFNEVKSLLIGEAIDDKGEKRMRQVILSVEGVDRVVDLKTLFVGPRELFVAMKVTVGAEDNAALIAQSIDEIEARLRKEFPIARLIYVEPDLYKTKREQNAADKEISQFLSE